MIYMAIKKINVPRKSQTYIKIKTSFDVKISRRQQILLKFK